MQVKPQFIHKVIHIIHNFLPQHLLTGYPRVIHNFIHNWGFVEVELRVSIKSEDMGADEICEAVYTIEKRRREALLLHLGRLIMGT